MADTALIWDLDGTLLDSYGVIVPSLQETLEEVHISADPAELLRRTTETSVSAVLTEAAEQTGLPFARLKARYSEISGRRALEIPPIPHARDILEAGEALGAAQFVYTHRGATTAPVLEHLHFQGFFKEVVTSLNGFPRKPDPAALLYLMERHHLDRDRVFYAGDRTLDVECAGNAGVRSILYSPSGTGTADFIVRDLLDVREILADFMGKEQA